MWCYFSKEEIEMLQNALGNYERWQFDHIRDNLESGSGGFLEQRAKYLLRLEKLSNKLCELSRQT